MQLLARIAEAIDQQHETICHDMGVFAKVTINDIECWVTGDWDAVDAGTAEPQLELTIDGQLLVLRFVPEEAKI